MPASDALVAAQGLALAALAWPGPARWQQPRVVTVAAGAAVLAGGALAGAGLRAQGGQLTPRVVPPAGAVLLTGGPYAVSRHPVYAGLLVAAAGWAAARRRPEPAAACAALAVVLHAKTALEERSLRGRFGAEWDAYATRTPRLLGRPRR